MRPCFRAFSFVKVSESMSKLTKKDLRSPDQIWQASATTFSWLRSQWIWLIVLGLVVFIGSTGAFFYVQSQKAEEAKAQALYGDALSFFEQYKLEKTESVLKELQSKLDDLKLKFPSSKANKWADGVRARLLIDQSKVDPALSILSESKSGLSPDAKAFISYSIAGISEDAERWDEAISNYQSILDLKDHPLKKWAFLGKARALVHKGQAGLAVVLYDQFITDFPRSTEISKVRGLRAMASQTTASK